MAKHLNNQTDESRHWLAGKRGAAAKSLTHSGTWFISTGFPKKVEKRYSNFEAKSNIGCRPAVTASKRVLPAIGVPQS